MSSIDCIIIEDEPLAVKVLKDYIFEVSFLNLKRSFKDAILALEFMRENKVDLIFLDIHLPKLKGMDFLKTLKQAPSVIITTAYHQYALEGYALNVTDYLKKPIEFDRFLQAVNKVKLNREGSIDINRDYFFLSVQKRKVKVLFSEILYVESQREYVKVVTLNQEHLSKISTKEMESILPKNSFKRIHRSFIIAMDKIDAFTSDEVDIQGSKIPIGRFYKGILEDLF